MSSVWDRVIGQPAAVGRLEAAAFAPSHAYLFLGPPGATKTAAARAFAVVLLTGSDDPDGDDARLAFSGHHPDIRELERDPSMTDKDFAVESLKASGQAPSTNDSKVIIIHAVDELDDNAVVRLLKTVEEPTPSTVLILIAQQIHREMITLASRCTVIEFGAIADQAIIDHLILEGTDPQSAVEAAAAARGDLTQARLLAADPQLASRRRLFAAVPHRIDGTGATAIALATELMDAVEVATAPIRERHRAELAHMRAEQRQLGRTTVSTKVVEDRHKRELRRYRRAAYRDGLSVLAGTYRDALVVDGFSRPDAIYTAINRIQRTIESLDRNANTALQLQTLIWDLPTVPVHDPSRIAAAAVPDR